MSTSVIKLSLCGPGGVGKTSLARVFTGGSFNESERITVGIQHFFKKLRWVNGTEVTISIWDLGGEHRFFFLAPAFLRGARGVVYVFDITREETFIEIENWRRVVEDTLGPIPAVLVGNKKDLESLRMVPRETALEYARAHNLLGYFEVSAKQLIEVEIPFLFLIKYILDKRREYEQGSSH
ncbi:MAG: Rab family GTPase [Infirmifilum sp.]|uniref:Rab family GTPase n=1 Tax=Infirmifilum sp. TaxID=2856575 RepID=UPI003D0D807A